MAITKEDVLHVARLARLELNAAQIDTFVDQLGDILAYVDTLNQVDTAGIEPTSHAIQLTDAFRDDRPAEHLETARALANAPESEDGSFIVPKVVG